MKRIAILMNWSRPFNFSSNKAGGMMTAALNLRDELGASLLYIKPAPGVRAGIHDLAGFEFIAMEDFLKREYDFAIFMAAGHSDEHRGDTSYTDMLLDHIRDFPPYAIWSHNEVEATWLHRTSRLVEEAKFVMAITSEIGAAVFHGHPFLEYPGYKKHLAIPAIAQRRKLAAMVCRMTTRKTVIPFIQESAPAFLAAGYEIDIHGPASSYFYAKRVTEAIAAVGGRIAYHGPTEDPLPIYQRARFNVNLPFLANGSFSPRLELSTIEAAEAGCMPIVLDETTPADVKWLIRVPRSDLASMYERAAAANIPEMLPRFIRAHNRKHASLLNELKRRIEE